MKQALAPGVRSIVLDCEAQAWDSERKVFLPFQVLTTRKRKDVKEEDVKVQVLYSDKQLYAHSILWIESHLFRIPCDDGVPCTHAQVVLYCFDCLYLDGEVLLRKPLRDRREAMYKSIIPEEGKLQFATAKTSRDIDELQVRLGCLPTGCRRPWFSEAPGRRLEDGILHV